MMQSLTTLVLLAAAGSTAAVATATQHRALQEAVVPPPPSVAALFGGGLPQGITECDDNNMATFLAPDHLPQPMAFCVHQGTCRNDYTSAADDGSFQFCDCEPPFGGPHCEFYKDEVPICLLQCQHGGACHVGAKTWQQVQTGTFWQEMADHTYCLCPEGYYGRECEHEGHMCGDNYCYHGGQCREVEATDESIHQQCDCTMAVSEDGVAHAGKYCQHEATSYCSANAKLDGLQMCMNGGICRTDGRAGCDCPEGFTGPVCEFEDLGLVPSQCDLECHHNGVCRKGAKDMTAMDVMNHIGRRDLKMLGHNENFEHCVCPMGFVGLQCEWELDVCPGSIHVCMNGGKCQMDFSGPQVQASCDCARNSVTSPLFLGAYCELEATDVCAVGLGAGREDAYCLNGGSCKDKVFSGEPHPGCHCMDNYAGDHCEFIANEVAFDIKLIIIIVVAALVLLVVGLFLMRRYKRRRARRAAINRMAGRERNLHDPPTIAINRSNSQLERLTRANPFSDSHSVSSDTSSNESRRRVDRAAQDLGRVGSTASQDPVFVFQDNSQDENSSKGRARRAMV